MFTVMPIFARSDLMTTASACPAASPLTVMMFVVKPFGNPAWASRLFALAMSTVGLGRPSFQNSILYGMNEVAGVAVSWYASLFISSRSMAYRTACRTFSFLKYWFLFDSWMKSTRVDLNRSDLSLGFALIWLTRLLGGFSITSTLPACRSNKRVLSLVTIISLMFLIFGVVPYQYLLTVKSTSESGL